MKILVCGGRAFSNKDWLFRYLDEINGNSGIECIIDGCASGADQLAHEWAVSRGIATMRFPANWNKHGKAAGSMRNRWMLIYGRPDMVVAFPGGRGTMDMINSARPIIEKVIVL